MHIPIILRREDYDVRPLACVQSGGVEKTDLVTQTLNRLLLMTVNFRKMVIDYFSFVVHDLSLVPLQTHCRRRH